MEENQAHSYYVDLKNKGSGAAMYKEGLGFDKDGPGSSSKGHIQFVAQKQDSHEVSEQESQALPGHNQPREPHPWLSATPVGPHQLQKLQVPPQGLVQQQPSHFGPNGMPQHSPQPAAPSPYQAGGMRPQGPQFAGQRPPGPAPGPMPGPPPRGPHNAWGGALPAGGPPPGGRGVPPRGPPHGPGAPGMPPAMMGHGLPPGMPPMRPPPGMRPTGMMQGFPGGHAPGFPAQRPPMGTPPQPPPQGWGQHQNGPPRPAPMMPHPMHRPPPQHPNGGPPMHLQHSPPPQQFPPHQGPPHMCPMPSHHQMPAQQQQQQQHRSPQPQLALPGPQPSQQARPPVPVHLNGAQAGPSVKPAVKQEPMLTAQPIMATDKPTTGGWMAHKSADGQVYYHNTSTGESSWVKPEGFEGDAAAGKGAPTPVSSEAIPTTGWSEVTCSDGRKYYYHADRKETSWSKPPEVAAALAKAIKAGSIKMAGMTADQVAIIARLKANNAQLNLRPELREAEDAEEDHDDVTFTDQDIGRLQGTAMAPPPQNPPLPSSLPPMMGTPILPGGPPRPLHFPGVHPQHQPPLPAPRSHDGLVQDFKDLLLETKVTPFSRWERELPKLVGDSRYKAIDKPKERRQIFDDFCRNVAEEQKRSKERKEQQAAAAEPAFLALLDEAEAWTEEDQEAAEPESSNADKADEDGEAVPADKPYNDLRVIRKALTAYTSTSQMEDAWGHDPRWQGIDSEVRGKILAERIYQLGAKQNEADEAKKAAREQAFRELLKDAGVSASSRYGKVKEGLRSDGRYKAIPHADREEVFNKHQAELKAEVEAKKREANAMHDREVAARQAEADAKRRQQEAAHHDAVAAFQTLLAETVKDPAARWQDWRGKLGKDPQGRADNKAFAPREQQTLFDKYVKDLAIHIEQDFRALMEQKLRPMLPAEPQARTRPAPLATFEAALSLLESDPRFERAAESERERLWREYVRDIVHERDHPQQRARPVASSRAAERDRGRSAKDVGDVVDKAYLREYIEPDQKRIRRE